LVSQLWHILSHPAEFANIISWADDGTVVLVRDPDGLVSFGEYR
jgi:hypothetical protein